MKSTFTGTTDAQGLKQSHGTYFYPNKFFKYEGHYADNQKQGLGKLFMRDGSFYEGEFKNGEINGKGVMQLSSGLRYEGKFLKGERHGFGILTKPDYKYEGNFREGRRHGQFSEFDYARDKFVKGEFRDDVLTGDVEVYKLSTNDLMYAGGVVNGKRNGNGELFAEEYHYKGEFVDDQLHGQGVLEDKNSGITYTGEFVNSKPSIMANTIKYALYLNKENKKGEPEREEVKLTGPIKLEPAKVYTISIKLQYQGEDFKNPDFTEEVRNAKKKTNIPEFLTPDPILITQESNRLFRYKLTQKFEDEVCYECDFAKEQQKGSDMAYQLDLENLATFEKNVFLTKEGFVEFNVVFPSNIKGGAYVLSVSNEFVRESNLGFEKMNDFVVAFDLISKFGAKK